MEDSIFMKRFLMFMGAEFIVAMVAIGYFLMIGSSQSSLAQAPVEIYDPTAKSSSESAVLGAETDLASDSHVIYKVVTPVPSGTSIKKAFRIAILGDSFEDTMGETGEFLQKSLKDTFPDKEFLIYNYGKGANTIKDGLENFEYNFQYGIRNYPSISDLKPDIIIIGSYANNPPNPFDRNSHWLSYTQLVQRALKVTSHVYVLAEVAPLREGYGDGPNGVNWGDETSVTYSGHVIELMENVQALSTALKVPLIDAFTPSLVEKNKFGKEGSPKDISVSDGINPSQEGHELMAKKIAESIQLD
ncbi:MAG: SGNH/GDSL hydrolase family protein [Patescibacteria group bacterium]